jgi:hypothetical protein
VARGSGLPAGVVWPEAKTRRRRIASFFSFPHFELAGRSRQAPEL